jgi:signal transduction histidine kinase
VPVRAELGLTEGCVVLEVRNPIGRENRPNGFPSGGHGLLGMRERAAMFDGTLDAGPVDGEFVVRAVLPVPGYAEPTTRPGGMRVLS